MLPVFINRCGAGRHVELIPSVYNISNDVGDVKVLGLLIFASLGTPLPSAHTRWLVRESNDLCSPMFVSNRMARPVFFIIVVA